MIVPAGSDRLRWEQLRREEPAARDKRDEIERDAEEGIPTLAGLGPASRFEPRRIRRLPDLLPGAGRDAPSSRRIGEEGIGVVRIRPGRPVRSHPLPGACPKDSFVEIRDFPRPRSGPSVYRFHDLPVSGGGLPDDPGPADGSGPIPTRGWGLEISGDRPSFNVQVKDGRNIGIRGVEENKLEPDRWTNLVVTYDGMRQRTGMNLYLDGAVVPTRNFGRAIRILEGSIRTDTPLVLGAGDRPSAGKSDFLDGSIRQFRVLDRAVNESEARAAGALGDAGRDPGTEPGGVGFRRSRSSPGLVSGSPPRGLRAGVPCADRRFRTSAAQSCAAAA